MRRISCRFLHIPVWPGGFLSGKYRTSQKEEIHSTLSWAPVEEYYCEDNVERLRRAECLAEKKGATVPAVVLAWALRQPMNLFCILSPSSRQHLEALLCAFQLSLSDEEAAMAGFNVRPAAGRLKNTPENSNGIKKQRGYRKM